MGSSDAFDVDLSELSDGQLADDWAGFRIPMCPGCGWMGYEPHSEPFAVGDPPGLESRETERHLELKDRAGVWLRRRGFTSVHEEQSYSLSRTLALRRDRPQRYVRVDVVARRSGRDVVAVECGTCEPLKLEALTYRFSQVWHWRFGADEPRRLPKSHRFPGLRIRPGIQPLPDWLRRESATEEGPKCPICGDDLEPAE